MAIPFGMINLLRPLLVGKGQNNSVYNKLANLLVMLNFNLSFAPYFSTNDFSTIQSGRGAIIPKASIVCQGPASCGAFLFRERRSF